MSKSSTKAILPVKLCYSHIGGQLGSLLTEHFIAEKWIEKTEGNQRLYSITAKGKKGFTALGIDLTLISDINIPS